MTKIADLVSLGYLGMRDETPNQLLDARTSVFGVRINDIKKSDMTYDLEDFGDLQFAHFYKTKSQQKRRIGSWSLATPSLWIDKKTLPIFDKDFTKDERYEEAETSSYLGLSFPKETPGITLAVSKEEKEEKIFFPSFGGLIAHHRGQDPPKYSSQVFDIDGAGKIDKDRKAGLHTAFWVQKLAPNLGALALNFTKSRGDFTGWGLYKAAGFSQTTIDRNASGDLMAFGSWEQGGPWHPGAYGDKHERMKTPDGPVNSGHIWTSALFFMDPVRDGPLDFEAASHPKSKEGIYPYQVHLRWDGGLQKWRWHVKLPFFFLEPPDGPIPPPRRPPYPPGGPDDPRRPPQPPGGPGDPKKPPKWPGDPGFPGFPKPPTGGPIDDYPKPPPGGWPPLDPPPKWDPPPKKKKRKKGSTLVFPWKIFGPGQGVIATPAREVPPEERHGTPESFVDDIIKKYGGGRYLSVGERKTEFVTGTEEETKAVEEALKKFPVVFQWEGFGREKVTGRIDKINDFLPEGVDQPDDFYPQGTGVGGLMISPPQLGMRDYKNGFDPKDIKACTPTGLLFLDAGKAQGNTYLAWGAPDLDTGLPKNGWQFRTFSGNLQLRGIDSTGSTDTTKTVDFSVGVVHNGSWKYPTGATANYVWTSDANGVGSWQDVSTLPGVSRFWDRGASAGGTNTTYLKNLNDILAIGKDNTSTGSYKVEILSSAGSIANDFLLDARPKQEFFFDYMLRDSNPTNPD
ncbi:MAG: hypothetical protein D6785_02500, partial [Planctomycetota bacterium]